MHANAVKLPAIAAILGLAACGPNASGSCPSPTSGAAEMAQAESAPEEAHVEETVTTNAEGKTETKTAASTGDAGAGDKPAEPGVDPKAGTAGTATAAAVPAGGGKFDIVGSVVSGTKPVKFAVAYLEGAPIEEKRGMKVVIDQRMMLFIPYIAAVAVGGSATFVNSDPFPHNVFSPSGDKFNLGTIPKGGGGRYKFKTPGAFTLLCNVHPGMIGYVYVTPSSYFATANAKGRFKIKDVPEGNYKIAAWAPKMGGPSKPIVVKGGELSVDIELQKQ
ncbi:MAG: hypothetical protein R3B13_32765 [Polyangiaceae bacterium]